MFWTNDKRVEKIVKQKSEIKQNKNIYSSEKIAKSWKRFTNADRVFHECVSGENVKKSATIIKGEKCQIVADNNIYLLIISKPEKNELNKGKLHSLCTFMIWIKNDWNFR